MDVMCILIKTKYSSLSLNKRVNQQLHKQKGHETKARHSKIEQWYVNVVSIHNAELFHHHKLLY